MLPFPVSVLISNVPPETTLIPANTAFQRLSVVVVTDAALPPLQVSFPLITKFSLAPLLTVNGEPTLLVASKAPLTVTLAFAGTRTVTVPDAIIKFAVRVYVPPWKSYVFPAASVTVPEVGIASAAAALKLIEGSKPTTITIANINDKKRLNFLFFIILSSFLP